MAKVKEKLELEWKKYDGTPILDVAGYVLDWSEKWPKGEIMIGCDSQEHSNHIKYSVTINMHMRDKYGMGKGGHVIFANIRDFSKTMKSDLYTKLWTEAELSVQAAQQIQCENLKNKLVIHLDFNSKAENYSNILYQSGIGFVKGMLGIEDVFGKPNAWAATHSADALCKNKQAKGIK